MFASFRRRAAVFETAIAEPERLTLGPHAASGPGHVYGDYDYQKSAQDGGQNKPSRTANEVTHQ
jgi:hypothetical protein